MLLKQLLNNLPIFPGGVLNCICRHVSIKINVLYKRMLIISITKCINLSKTGNCLLLLDEHVTT